VDARVGASRVAGAVAIALLGLTLGCTSGDGDPAAGDRTGSGGRGTPSGTAPADAGSTADPDDPCDVAPTTVTGRAGQSVFVDAADFVTALAWAPDGRLFFAERSGAIRIARAGRVTTFATVPTVTTEPGGGYSERGLLGLALSPTFATDHFVYAFYSRADHATQVVVRFVDCAGAASEPVTLLTFPAGSDCCHKGGRLAFGPDGKLYVTLGEQHAVSESSVGNESSIPQDPADVRGKILRYEPEGRIPADNPFGPTSAAWATGFRNVFGIAFGPSGALFATDNGPTGDLGTPRGGYDLALMVTRGSRAQWPACYGYGHLVPGASTCLGRAEPDWSSERDTLVPTGATYVDDRGPTPFAGRFVFCTAVDGMRAFVPGTPRATVVAGPAECRFDVKQGPDHALYFSDEGAIHRLAAD
jgi:glucose/arabinose dehydrogenase